ncbi:hypothetical protein KPH14_004931 [Odynerus spinipes]|uniref:Large ribosomal subunit protein mL40 n=1 Tax=Odynerus spinipes TaxID=1348599 RepID=A0AAD9RMT7_9HYME|nr:hypothetical protein KPH14_004931 [Odynerus spinipes]
MGLLSVTPILLRLSKCAIAGTRTISTSGNPLQFGITNVLLAEPLKKKKKLDPAIVRQREEKKRRRLEKTIRRLEKSSRQLKPISELEIPLFLKIEKEYKHKQHINDVQTIDKFISSQYKALNELRAESEELYNEAIQIDLSFLPYATKGPYHTPPIENYDSPDGEYIDLTQKYPGET